MMIFIMMMRTRRILPDHLPELQVVMLICMMVMMMMITMMVMMLVVMVHGNDNFYGDHLSVDNDSYVTQAWLAETQGWDDNDNVSSNREQTLR